MLQNNEFGYDFHSLDFSGKYQYFPHLRKGEFDALVQSISQYGQKHAIEMDESGHIIDGHHRFLACEVLGIEPLINILHFEDEESKIIYVKKANLARRHLNTEEKRQLIADELRRRPESSNNSIAKMLGVSDRTVGNVRNALGIFSNQRVGADGKTYTYNSEDPNAMRLFNDDDGDPLDGEFDVGDFTFTYECPKCGFEFS